ncbi:MAG: tRNA (adenosine(37)-N6)-dimethylallyltransferase MiaA [Lachnospiraceae bacterium]|nr:tRNA (adenosine(37)-N6)-dimethylallyltransferase MiaA [Lachnospiraceae bacterium]
MEKPPLIILAGPTAVGKTDLSIALAKAVGGEIISCDSMQAYRYMDIGSAKISPEEMQGVPHYLVDELLPTEDFNVAVFMARAKKALESIYANGHIPIAVGGTGFYIQALLYDTEFTAEEDNQIRHRLEEIAQTEGGDALFRRLKEVDPASAEKIHPNNVKRVIRAIEYYELHGRPISEHNEQERRKESPYHFCYFVLNDSREHLYENIDKRVDLMLQAGLLEEVQKLHQMGYSRDLVSMQGLGYKELLEYLEGDISLDEAIYKIKRDTRHFAKRQLTWFRNKPEVTWVSKDEFGYQKDQILSYMLEQLHEKNIIS